MALLEKMQEQSLRLDISVIIPTYNRKAALKDCLSSLSRQNYPQEKFEVIIIDDGSKEDITASFEYSSLQIKFFRQEHHGASSARNSGIKKAQGDILAFIDDDCTVPRDWIGNIIRCHKIYPGIKVIQGRIDSFYKNNFWADASQNSFNAHLKNKNGNIVDWVLTGNLSCKREIISIVGGFDEDLMCLEDYDFAYRLREAREKIIYIPEITACHLHRNNFFDFVRQQFNFGRGRYKLALKWKNKVTLSSPGPRKMLYFWFYTFRRARLRCVSLFFASVFRKIFFSYGYIYEKIKYRGADGK